MTLAPRTPGGPARDGLAPPHNPHGAGKRRRPQGGGPAWWEEGPHECSGPSLGGVLDQTLFLPSGQPPCPLPRSPQTLTCHRPVVGGQPRERGEDHPEPGPVPPAFLDPRPPRRDGCTHSGPARAPAAAQAPPTEYPGCGPLGVRVLPAHLPDCGAVSWGSRMRASLDSWVPTACSGPTAETSGSP